MIRTAFNTAKARLHCLRKSAGVTDIQATIASDLLDETSKRIEKSIRDTGIATFTKGEAEAIVRTTKNLGNGNRLDETETQLTMAIVAFVACEFRAAGYVVHSVDESDSEISIALV